MYSIYVLQSNNNQIGTCCSVGKARRILFIMIINFFYKCKNPLLRVFFKFLINLLNQLLLYTVCSKRLGEVL